MLEDPIRATLIARRDATGNIGIFTFRPEREITWEPGQYVNLGIPGPDPVVRAYSIASAPSQGVIELFIEVVPGGTLTPIIWGLRVGDGVTFQRPEGSFSFDRESGNRTHFMVGTVTGAAPYLSMIRQVAHDFRSGKDEGFRIVLIHGGSRSGELGYVDEMRGLDDEMPWFTYVPTISRPWEEEGWTGETGRAEEVIRKHLDPLEDAPRRVSAYLCGNPDMIDAARGILRRAGLPEEHILEEKYF
jgi:ferredoxin--NADP+ reductase